jgi:hypothetical protein
MDANLIEAIKTIAITLGPAIIAAYATYKATMGQLNIKLRELEKKHEFGVREQLFNYYKDRLESLSGSYATLQSSLAQLIGMTTTMSDVDIEIEFSGLALTLFEFAELESRKSLLDIKTNIMYMDQEGLKGNEDYNKLMSFVKPLQNLGKEKTFQVIRTNIFIISEAYHVLQRCHQILIGKQMDLIFKKYIEE